MATPFSPRNAAVMAALSAYFHTLDDLLREAEVAARAGDKERYASVMQRFDNLKQRGPVDDAGVTISTVRQSPRHP
jgi:hypothetical protein